MNIENKVAIVTGSARGIGRAIVEKLLEKGAKGVAILDILDETGEETCKTLKAKFGQKKVIYIHCDVSVAYELEAAFSNAVKNFGGLDIVCNNAGFIDEFNWEKMVDVNQKGVIRGTYLAIDNMGVKNGGKGGVVINTASVVGIVPYTLLPVYSATKHAIVGFTRSAAVGSLVLIHNGKIGKPEKQTTVTVYVSLNYHNEPNIQNNKIRLAAVCPGKVITDLTGNASAGCRYKEELTVAMGSAVPTPMAQLTDAVVKLIEDAESNGKICFVSASEELFIEPPDIKY